MELLQKPGFEHPPDLRAGLFGLLTSERMDFFATLAFNRPGLGIEAAAKACRHFHAVIDRRMLGKHWSKLEGSKRTLFIGIPERTKTGAVHVHGLLRVPAEGSARTFEAVTRHTFAQKIGGTLDLRPVESSQDQERIAGYLVKGPFVAQYLLLN